MTIIGVQDLRPEVLAFACQMEETLRKNDHKGGWHNLSPQQMEFRLHHEVEELRQALAWAVSYGGHWEDVANEAADVANFCLFLHDYVRREKT